ncbi:MAG: PrsW family intramembrane metalloprotease, partial [Anaerolineales bacterium]|nr:PrsW family intramembrane metalloprotease [Anaerolineales bacterium]
MENPTPSKTLAILAIITGLFLLVSGFAAGIGYLGFTIFDFGGAETLIEELSTIGAFALGLIGGGPALFHGVRSLSGQRSAPFRLPPFYIFYLIFALVLGGGSALLVGLGANRVDGTLVQLVFPFLFILGASLPALAALAFAYRRLNWPVTWRQAALMFVSGGTLSIVLTFFFANFLPFVVYLLVEPLGFFAEEFLYVFDPGFSGLFERLFYSPLLLFYLISIAVEAPFPEELAKAVGPGLMGGRIRSERVAFALGLASGAGFAVVENMRYQGLFAQFYGWSWGGITALRGIGAVDHALWTAIIALAWYRERERNPGWVGRLGRAYMVSVGLHTLWNGGYMALLYLIGLDHLAGTGPSFSVYGEYVELSLIIILVAMTLLNWWILIRYLKTLQTEEPAD